MRDLLEFLLPWEFSPTAFLLCFGAVGFYTAYLVRTPPAKRPNVWRRTAFFTGWALIYFVMQTRFDYIAAHMFFLHRIQHLVLHHMGPFLVALALPLPVPDVARRFASHPAARVAWRSVQNWAVAPVLFVGLLYFWLTPSIHFVAMLNSRSYWMMNWSMLIDGLLFWSLVLDPRSKAQGALLGYGARLWMVLLAIPPQIVLGSYIALSARDLFDVYDLCGRAWGLDAHSDQVIGGLVTWIPAGMMHALAAIIVFSRWARFDEARAPRTMAAAS